MRRTHDRSWGHGLLALFGAGLALGGCASIGSYHDARREAEEARLAYEQEARRSQELTVQTTKLREQADLLEIALRKAREDLERREREDLEARETLAALKGQPTRGDQGSAKPSKPTGAAADARKARLKDLLKELQAILDQ